MYAFYIGDTATELAGGTGDAARKLFLRYLDELLDQERAKAPSAATSGAAKTKRTKKPAR